MDGIVLMLGVVPGTENESKYTAKVTIPKGIRRFNGERVSASRLICVLRADFVDVEFTVCTRANGDIELSIVSPHTYSPPQAKLQTNELFVCVEKALGRTLNLDKARELMPMAPEHAYEWRLGTVTLPIPRPV